MSKVQVWQRFKRKVNSQTRKKASKPAIVLTANVTRNSIRAATFFGIVIGRASITSKVAILSIAPEGSVVAARLPVRLQLRPTAQHLFPVDATLGLDDA